MEEFGLDYVADSEKGENWLAEEGILRRRLFAQLYNYILDGDVRCKYRCDGWPYQICEVLSAFLLPGQFRLPYRPRRDQDRPWARPPAAVRMLGETEVVSPPTIPSIRLGHSRSEIEIFQIVIKWGAHSVATPALLCRKEPARDTRSPLLGALVRNAPY